jgi:hypothetical protein
MKVKPVTVDLGTGWKWTEMRRTTFYSSSVSTNTKMEHHCLLHYRECSVSVSIPKLCKWISFCVHITEAIFIIKSCVGTLNFITLDYISQK